MRPAPYFSVIIPTFNRPQLLQEAIASVLAQTVEDFECIVVNDGQTGVELPDDDRLRLIDKREALGMAASINTGIQEARGKFLTFLDDDDSYTPQRLELAMRGSKLSPLSVCWRANFDTGIAGRNRMLDGWVHDTVLDRSPPMLGQTTVERTQMVPLEERTRHACDVEWWIRATRVLPVATVPEVGLLLRRHPGRQSHDMAIRYTQRMLMYSLHAEYFKTHRRAAARFHKRTGFFAYEAGFIEAARQQHWKAVKASPTPRTVYHLARALLTRQNVRTEALSSDP
jgi:glycosyltransferase involved in cell wall biosynthesis